MLFFADEKSALFIMLSSSSNESAIVSSSSKSEKKPPSFFFSSWGITISSCSWTDFTDSSALISSILFFKVFISFLRFCNSAIICCKIDVSTEETVCVVFWFSETVLSFSCCESCSVDSVFSADLISFTTGALVVFSSPTNKS